MNAISALAIIEEYGLYASDKWIRTEFGLLTLNPEQVSEGCRKLTKTMLSIRYLKESELKEEITWQSNILSTTDSLQLINKLAIEEDRSITWPDYPNPKTYTLK